MMRGSGRPQRGPSEEASFGQRAKGTGTSLHLGWGLQAIGQWAHHALKGAYSSLLKTYFAIYQRKAASSSGLEISKFGHEVMNSLALERPEIMERE